jgi:group I intron endonuclease
MRKVHQIYKITNITNGKLYIGQSLQPQKRWYAHKNNSAKDNPSMLITQKIKEYGNSNFDFEIIASGIEDCVCQSGKPGKCQEDINEVETILILQYESHVSTGKGYNVARQGGHVPKCEVSAETKQKMSEARKGKKHSKESKEKMSIAQKGKIITAETKQKMSIAKKDKKLSEQHAQKISGALKGKPAHNKGQPRSMEVKNKISETMKDIVFSEDHKQNLSDALKGKKHSEESKQKMRKPKSEETKRRMSEAQRKRYEVLKSN